MNNILQLYPLLILAAASIVVLLAITLYRNHLLTFLLTCLAYVIALFSISLISNAGTVTGDLFVVNQSGVFFITLILLSGLIVIVIAWSYLKEVRERREEYYVILILGTLGGSVLVLADHFISFFLGLELLSISLYILIGFTRERQNSIEAGIKYLLLAGVSSAILLMGMALIYAESGALEFMGIAQYINEKPGMSIIFLSGTGLILSGIGFKMALVPFHLWTPDVYEGAPAPTTAFIATISKVSIVVVLIRLYLSMNGPEHQILVFTLSGIAFLSMLTGNLLALLQTNLKRLLAYSSIAHFGYVLVALLAGRQYGTEAVAFYLVAYVLTILGAFSIISLLSNPENELSEISDYKGFFWQRPWLASAMVVMLLSLAGIPLTAGFIGKYYVLLAGVNNGFWILVFTLVISSVIGLFYYLRVIVEMFKNAEKTPDQTPVPTKISIEGGVVLTLISVLLILYGTYPAWLSDLVNAMVASGF